jgi:hypothetical protein
MKKPEASSLHSTGLSRKTLIAQRARILFSAFRQDQYADPESYAVSVGMVLEQYPNDVIIYITDPRTGVQRHCKWPPTIAEIIEACDKRMQHAAKMRQGKKHEPLALGPPNEARPTSEELKAKYGDNWGIAQEPKKEPQKAPSWEFIASYYQANPGRIKALARSIEDSTTESP